MLQDQFFIHHLSCTCSTEHIIGFTESSSSSTYEVCKLSSYTLNKDSSVQLLSAVTGAAIQRTTTYHSLKAYLRALMDTRTLPTLSLYRNRQEQLASKRRHFPAVSCHIQAIPREQGFQEQNANKQREQHCASSWGSSISATLRTRLQNMMERVERVHGCNEMELLRAGGPEQRIFVLCKLHRSLTHEGREKKKQLCSPCGCLAADGSQKTTMQPQIILPPAYICTWKSGHPTGNSL